MQLMQLPLKLHLLKPMLPQRLIQHNGNRIGKVQGTDITPHGDTDAAVFILYQDFLGNPGAFTSE